MASATILWGMVAVVLSLAQGSLSIDAKMLGGPPSEFNRHKIPDSSLGALFQTSATQFLNFEKQGDGFLWSTETEIVVDSDTGFEISIMSPLLNEMQISMTDPSGNPVDMSSRMSKVKSLF